MILTNADVLVGYSWDARSSRYRSDATGQYVARRHILGLVEAQVSHSTARLNELTAAFYEKRLSGAVWVEQVRTELKRQHLSQAALGAGGWDRLNARDFGRVGGHLKADYAKIAGTAQEIADGKITLPQALARVTAYVGSARRQFYAAERDRLQRSSTSVIIIGRRILGDSKHCKDCVEFYNRGWQIAGMVPLPGSDSVCRDHCRCSVEYREVPAVEVNEWLNTKR